MGIGPKLYALFPGLFERVAGKSLSKNRRFPHGNLLFYCFQSHNHKQYPQSPRINQFQYLNESPFEYVSLAFPDLLLILDCIDIAENFYNHFLN